MGAAFAAYKTQAGRNRFSGQARAHRKCYGDSLPRFFGAGFTPTPTTNGRDQSPAKSPMLYPPQSASRRAFAARSLSLVASLVCCCLFSFASPASAKTAMQAYVEAMQPGWNLGNTLDATPNETAWGNPLTTQALIHQIKAQGFKSIRIPVTWDTGNRLGPAPSYTIDPAWLDRVQQVVDWSLAEGLYVMLNVHHDSYWVRDMATNHDAVLAKFNAIWSQVAPRFRDHSDKLMFESINEPDFLNASDATKMSLLNELNTSFFHIVRNTGGGNATRPLVLPSFNTNSSQQWLDSLKATMTALNDPNLIATVHFYGFWPFSVNIAGVTTVNDAVVADINATVNNTYNTFIADGIPVVVGELGLLNWGPDSLSIERGEALKFFEIFTAAARAKGITWQLWDAGQLFNRTTYQWKDPELVDYYMQSLTTRSSTAATDLIFVPDGAPADAVIPLNLNGNTFVSLTSGATTLTPGVDYTIAGDVLTVKAGALAAFASGGYGEKAVLTANFSAGVPWKLHVRHNAAPALGAVSGTKSGALVIPTSFNGDLLATMEAKYVAAPAYPYPGPAEWTSFKGYDDAYLPDYTNNTITIKKEFFAATTNDAVDLTFHFWSGKKVNYRVTFQPGGGIIADPQELTIYDNQFYGGWGNWSWTPTNENSTEVVHSPTKSIAIDANPWSGSMLGNWMLPLNRPDYRTLTVWANGGAVGGQRLTVSAVYNWAGTGSSVLTDPLPANTWTKLEISLNSLGVTDSSLITGLVFSNNSGAPLPRYYLDDVRLTTAYPSTTVFVNGGAAPVVTSAISAAGVFNSPFSYAVTAINAPTSFSVTGLPAGLAIDATTGVISGTPSAAGAYVATVTATNASGSGSQTVAINIAPAPATIALSGLTFTYDGAAKSATVTTTPSGLPVSVTYNGGPNAPINAGSYAVVAAITDPNYAAAPASGTLVIQQAAATISLPSGSTPFSTAINASYNGTAQGVNLTTSPAGLPVTITYNGSTTAPTLPGTYHVVVTSADANYTGSVEGTFVITTTALVRYVPTINGDLDGSLQLLHADSFAVNGSGSVASDLLVPGTPTVRTNGNALFAGVVDATGAAAPTNYTVTLNGGAVVRYVVRRVDPIALPTVTPVAQPTGTREVTLNKASQTVGDFATVRSLTLNGNAGSVAVPAGVYGSFTVNGDSSLVLGVAGASEPAVYELQSLTLNGKASLQIAGPVKLKLANGTTFNGTVGSADHPEWLQLEIVDGSVTLNGGAIVNAIVTAPKGSVTLNGTLHGRVSAERLTINGSGVLADPTP